MTYTLKERNKIRENYKLWYPFCPVMTGFHECLTQEYFVEFNPTVIEFNFWNDIRCLGLVLYPKFPVGKYFLDFADPIKRVGIELDGEAYHNDEKKDKKRQKEIEEQGWTIFRFKGRDTFGNLFQEPDVDGNIESGTEGQEEYIGKLRLFSETLTKFSDRPKFFPNMSDFNLETFHKVLQEDFNMKEKKLKGKVSEKEYQRYMNRIK